MSNGSELNPIDGLGDAMLVVKAMRALARAASRKPSVKDRDALVEYARTLDNRRVLSVSYDGEVVECCVGSLASLLELTERTLVRITHARARIVLQTIQDTVRRFLDRWRGFSTRQLQDDDFPRRAPPAPWHMRGEAHASFFLDLGELRVIVRQMVAVLHEIDAKIDAPILLGRDAD